MQTLEVVRGAYDSFQHGDIAGVLASCSEDVQWFLPGDPGVIPIAGLRDGVSGVARFFATLAETQEAEQFEPREFVVQGEKVIALGEYRWRVKKTGKAFRSDFAHVFTIRDGKIAGFHEFYDTAMARDCYAE